MEKFSRLKVKVIEVADAEGFQTKLNLDRLSPKGPCLFFDCDLWSLREWNAKEIIGSPVFVGVHDHAVWNCHTFCHHDCLKHGLVASAYINTGLFFWRNDSADHREVFRIARASWAQKKAGKKVYEDVTDQAHLNFGLLETKTRVSMLPIRYNMYAFGVRHGQFPYFPRDVINLHGAGITPKKKFSQMKAEAKVFGQKIYPMHQAAINWDHARQFDLR